MASATRASGTSTLVQGGTEGHPALLEEDGIYTVVDEDGNTVFEGGEVGAEFKYWNTVFGVPADGVKVVE
jgi:hypothetical protein